MKTKKEILAKLSGLIVEHEEILNKLHEAQESAELDEKSEYHFRENIISFLNYCEMTEEEAEQFHDGLMLITYPRNCEIVANERVFSIISACFGNTKECEGESQEESHLDEETCFNNLKEFFNFIKFIQQNEKALAKEGFFTTVQNAAISSLIRSSGNWRKIDIFERVFDAIRECRAEGKPDEVSFGGLLKGMYRFRLELPYMNHNQMIKKYEDELIRSVKMTNAPLVSDLRRHSTFPQHLAPKSDASHVSDQKMGIANNGTT